MNKPLKLLAVAVLFGATTIMSACAEHSRSVVYVRTPPPPPIRETLIAAPGPGYIWIPGHQAWYGNSYGWVPGRWERRPERRHAWIPGHWVQNRHGWHWVEGHWR
jgi:hypothetical protein